MKKRILGLSVVFLGLLMAAPPLQAATDRAGNQCSVLFEHIDNFCIVSDSSGVAVSNLTGSPHPIAMILERYETREAAWSEDLFFKQFNELDEQPYFVGLSNGQDVVQQFAEGFDDRVAIEVNGGQTLPDGFYRMLVARGRFKDDNVKGIFQAASGSFLINPCVDLPSNFYETVHDLSNNQLPGITGRDFILGLSATAYDWTAATLFLQIGIWAADNYRGSSSTVTDVTSAFLERCDAVGDPLTELQEEFLFLDADMTDPREYMDRMGNAMKAAGFDVPTLGNLAPSEVLAASDQIMFSAAGVPSTFDVYSVGNSYASLDDIYGYIGTPAKATAFLYGAIRHGNTIDEVVFEKRGTDLIQLVDTVGGQVPVNIHYSLRPASGNRIAIDLYPTHPALPVGPASYSWTAFSSAGQQTKTGENVTFVFDQAETVLFRAMVSPPNGSGLLSSFGHREITLQPFSEAQAMNVLTQAMSTANRDGLVETEVVVSGEGFTVSEMESVTVFFGDGNYIKSEKSGSSPPQTLFTHEYEPGTYRLSAAIELSDGRMSSQIQTIEVTSDGVGDPGFNITPGGDRVSPEYRSEYFTGEIQRFKVDAFDADCNLSHVIWGSNGPAEIQESDNRDDVSNSCSDIESMNFEFTGDNGGQSFDITATVYDDVGASREVRWIVDVTQTYAPQISRSFPPEQNTQVPLGNTDFEVQLFDQDHNLDYLEWYLDGVLVETDNQGGGNPAELHDRQFTFSERALHQIRARVYDDNGLWNEVQWQVEAGQPLEGNIPPEITYFGFDNQELPFQWLRAGREYTFRANAIDVDDGVIYYAMDVNGTRVYEITNGTPDFDEGFDHAISFPAAGQYQIDALFRDASGETSTASLSYDVLPADSSAGMAPTISALFPRPGTVYNDGTSLDFGAVINDAEWDVDYIVVMLNGSEHDRIRVRDFPSVEERIRDLPATGTHNVELFALDSAGNRSTSKFWTLRQGQLGNQNPSVQATLPRPGAPIRVMAGEHARLFVFADDSDGDLDRVEWDMSGVSDPDPDDSAPLNNYLDADRQNVYPAHSGPVYATIYDEQGNASQTISFNLDYVASTGNSPPQLMNDNLPPQGATVIRKWEAEDSEVEFMLDVWDPDGDFQDIRLFMDGVQVSCPMNSAPGYEFDVSFWSDIRNYCNAFLGDRGQVHEFELVVTDVSGNELRREWNMVRGPIGPFNHAPSAPDVTLEMDQRTEAEFTVEVTDEEGDTAAPTILGLADGDIVEYEGDYTFTYSPDDAFFGVRTFQIEWDDGFGGVSTSDVTVTINRVILPPELDQNALSVALLDGETFDLGGYLDVITGSEAYSNSELVFVEESANNVTSSGNALGEGALSVELTSDQGGQLTGRIKDPDGRQSQLFTLSISRNVAVSVQRTGSGDGTVSAIGTQLNCGVSCEDELRFGDELTLTASALQGSVFQGWGGPCSGTADCTLTLLDDTVINATFAAGSDVMASLAPDNLTVAAGETFQIELMAENTGPLDVSNAAVALTLPAGIVNASWSCTGTGGGSCASTGQGGISETVALPAGSTVAFTLTAELAPETMGVFELPASIQIQGDPAELDPANNASTLILKSALIFTDSFR